MNKKLLFTLWGVLFGICAGFGLIGQPGTAVRILGYLFAFGFFGVGGFILWQANGAKDLATITLIRNLSLASLILTAILLISNFLSVFASEGLGNFLHYVLVIVSSPMSCAPSWAVSLFLWACLMVVSQNLMKAKSR